MQDNFQIKDESNDRKYFTIIPNYILNHSTATAQALYMQLKRLAGESGIAFPSRSYLTKKLGISKNTLLKELKYLIDHSWIKHCGLVEVMTAGGEQRVNAYRIVDLWELNANFYSEKGVQNRTTLDKGGSKCSSKGVQNRATNKNYINKNKKPFFQNMPMRQAHGKWWVIRDGKWLEFVGEEKNIVYK